MLSDFREIEQGEGLFRHGVVHQPEGVLESLHDLGIELTAWKLAESAIDVPVTNCRDVTCESGELALKAEMDAGSTQDGLSDGIGWVVVDLGAESEEAALQRRVAETSVEPERHCCE